MNARAFDARTVASALGGDVASPTSVVAPGPNHSPQDRSLSIRLDPEAPDGFTLHSHAGDDWRDCRDYVRQKLDEPSWEPKAGRERPHEPHGSNPGRRRVASYVYRDADGVPYLRVDRYEGPKSFPQYHWTGSAWDRGKPKGPKIPYRLPELLAAPEAPVLIVEGEKDADRLAALGLAATTASEGAGKWTPDLARWFAGRRVFILPDYDQPGREHAGQVAASLHGVAAEVRVVTLPGVPEKGDVSDWLAAGGDKEGLAALCRAAALWTHEPEERGNPQDQLAPTPRPFVWRDPTSIESRPWLYGFHLLRKQVSVTVAPPGLGKSSLIIVEGLAMASGRDLLGEGLVKRLHVWIINLEDPLEELERRVTAAMIHHRVRAEEVEGRLFLSGREEGLCTAVMGREGVTIMQPAVDDLASKAKAGRIDVVSVDPFISSHQVPENDNGPIDKVAKEWAALADRCDCAVELIHHTRKLNGEDGTSESGRGATALLAAARSGRVLNRMTDQQKAEAGIADDPATYFSVVRDKANLAPPGKRVWRRMASVDLGNGDIVGVGVAERWAWPDTFDGLTSRDLLAAQKGLDGQQARYSDQADDWAGNIVAQVLGLDATRDKKRIKRMIESWLGSCALVKVSVAPAGDRHRRPCIEVGEWATE